MRLLVCDGKVSKELAKSLNSISTRKEKDGQNKSIQIHITGDNLSEGVQFISA